MPRIIVYAPRLSRERKVASVAALIRAFEESTGLGANLLTIHIEADSYDNTGVGGQLLTDTCPEISEREKQFLNIGA
ncbi:tautomerase family protein [Microbulbifer sp. 2304DJ12-6]|uniref:tautomerase family protein n=1 Tax=Microbulbifer sp. 2304DJ12-6 TaxID=3233340 RepID=UPI0039AF9B87